MDPLVVIIGGVVLFFLLFTVALGAWHPRSGRQIVGRSLRNPEAEADIEAGDVDQMVEAQDEMRRRAGRPSVGDELEREARRPDA